MQIARKIKLNILVTGSVMLFALPVQAAQALDFAGLPEFFRPDPFGGIVKSDRPASGKDSVWLSAISLRAARGGYVSVHLVARNVISADCQLQIHLPLTTDVYREWFHFNTTARQYYPDALIPAPQPYQFKVPDPENNIPGQTAQAFWADVWIPASTEPKTYWGEAILTAGEKRAVLPIEIVVLKAVIPAEDAVVLDNNSYGSSWLAEQYPQTLHRSTGEGIDEDRLLDLIHAYHRIFYDHRGIFHQLGYGHAGKVGPEFAPELAGTGKTKHVASWELFDRHYGPLLDGAAFRDSRRGVRPIPHMYLPVNPEWPASYLWWGEPGYEAEFVNVLAEMERHFREKHWTNTRFEVFFNQKKRYKGFPWDGDEVRFDRDNNNFIVYRRLLDKAIPTGSPVHFVMRVDSSWSIAGQSRELEGVINLWAAGEGELSWYPDVLRRLKQHGDTVWTYGGTPTVQEVSAAIALHPLRQWISGVDGFVRWQTVDPGRDPWFHLAGGGETLVYPGERFHIAGPLASIRLKLQRNCLQDLALIEAQSHRDSRVRLQEEVVRRFNNSKLSDWSNSNPKLPDKPVLDWNNADIGDALKPYETRFAHLEPDAWLRVREFVLEEVGKNQ